METRGVQLPASAGLALPGPQGPRGEIQSDKARRVRPGLPGWVAGIWGKSSEDFPRGQSVNVVALNR